MKIGSWSKFKENSFISGNSVKKIFHFWIKHHEALFIIISLLIFGLGLYFSYTSLYKKSWDGEKERQYINSQRQKINFKEDDFKQVIKEIDRKKETYQKEFPPVKDIFKPLGE